jgi:hypothetical protein
MGYIILRFQSDNPSNPTPTLTLPLKGREIVMFLPFQRGEGVKKLRNGKK